jgi:hypothetical protein
MTTFILCDFVDGFRKTGFVFFTSSLHDTYLSNLVNALSAQKQKSIPF